MRTRRVNMEPQKSWLEEFKQAQAATVRALAADPGIAVSFRQDDASPENGQESLQVHIALPAAEPSGSALAALRGAADLAALRHRFHEARLHARCAPRGNPARNLFDWLEDARIAAIGARMLPGVAMNLDAELEGRCRRAFLDTVTHRDGAPLDIALGLLVREHLSGRPLPPAAEHIAAFWRDEVDMRAGAAMRDLDNYLSDQAGFAAGALRLLGALDLLQEDAPPRFPSTTGGNDGANEPDAQEGTPSTTSDLQDAHQTGDTPDALAQERGSRSMADDGPRPGQATPESGGTPHPVPTQPTAENGYRIYTREFDRTVHADALAEGDEMAALRRQLDRQSGKLRRSTLQQAGRLQRRLLARQSMDWTSGLEEGLLDTARLAAAVTRSSHAAAFRQARDASAPDTALTLLIDCSGSMRGHPIAVAALCADILAQSMERCRIRVEVLGFSTQDWRGGHARRRWLAEGQPPQPGRLNDLLHVVYKQADEPWRRARKRLGMLLKEELLRENIDGEALLWAHERLLARPEQRRVLVVLSDGMPMDTATNQVNRSDLLARHLSHVVDVIERHSPVELLAIGIGHDVGRFYRRAVTIRHVDQLGGALFGELAALFGVPLRGNRIAGDDGAFKGR